MASKKENHDKTLQVIPFETFNSSKGKWVNWVKRLEMTFELFNVTDEENRRKMLLCHMGMEAFEVVIEAVAPAQPEKLSYAQLVSCLTHHYDPEGAAPELSEAQHCWLFWQRHQLPTEDVQSFMDTLRELVIQCDFQCDTCNCQSRIVRNQFVCGVRDENIRKALSQEVHLTEEKALEVAKKMENEEEPVVPLVEKPPKKKSPPSPAIENFVNKNCYQCTHRYVKNAAKWHLIRLRELAVTDWEDVFIVLKQHGATGLDLREIQPLSKKMWKNFSFHVKMLEQQLLIVTIEDCPAEVVSKMFLTNPNLKNVNADSVQGPKINFKDVENASKLEELHVRAKTELQIKGDLVSMGKLLSLKRLTLVGIKGLSGVKLESLGGLINLTDLEIGDCSDVDDFFFSDTLPKLPLLQRLRIMGARDEAKTTAFVNAVAQKIPWLRQLELVNFELKKGFKEAIAKCTNLNTLLLAPIYPNDSAHVVSTILHSLNPLFRNLKVFTWIITSELVKIADNMGTDTNNTTINTGGFARGQSLPVAEPVYDLETVESRTQTALRSITYFERTFDFSLPNTFVKIVKIPFEKTCRAAVVEAPEVPGSTV
ncbi:hypothetical protein DMENIID0001_058650 [Sergentomyia squamirostris]